MYQKAQKNVHWKIAWKSKIDGKKVTLWHHLDHPQSTFLTNNVEAHTEKQIQARLFLHKSLRTKL